MSKRSKGYTQITKRVASTKALEQRDLTFQQLQIIQNGGWYSGGVIVNEQTALSIPAVNHCVRIISGTISSLENHVYKRVDNGKTLVKKHPADRSVNAWDHVITNRQKMWSSVMVNALLTGEGYLEIERFPNGSPGKLLLHLSRNVEIREHPDHGVFYWLRKECKSIAPENMVVISCMGFNGVCGMSPIRTQATAIGNAILAQEYLFNLFQNDSTPSGFIEIPNHINEDALKNKRDQWNAVHAGTSGKGKLGFLTGGSKYVATQLNPVTMELTNQMKAQVADIARVFGVPLSMMNIEVTGDGNHAAQNQLFIDLCLRNWLWTIECECNQKLLRPQERDKYFFEYSLGSLLRGDEVARSNYYKNMWALSAINANEIRCREGLNPYEGGDKYFAPVNNVAPVNDKDPVGDSGKPVPEPDPNDPVANLDKLKNSIEPSVWTSVGRLVRRGFKQIRKDPDKIHDFAQHSQKVLEPLLSLVRTVNPVIDLESMVFIVQQATRAVTRETELADQIHSATKRILGSIDTP